MRIPTRAVSTEVGFNMTPMIDVVFQLIIFFLLSSHLAKQEKQLPLALPTAKSGTVEAADARPRLTINVLADGTLLVANRPIKSDDLAGLLRERRAGPRGRAGVRTRAARGGRYPPVP